MRIVVAKCSAIYTGRGDTKLEKATRAIILKDDGSISLHNDKSNKPLNYMGKGNTFTETKVRGKKIWTFDTRKESLEIVMFEIISDTEFAIDLDDTGLVRDGTENHLQEWLAANPESLGEGFTLVEREYATGQGPVDILVRDADGNPVVVEVKRVAMLNTVGQVLRYQVALQELEGFENTRAMIAALDIRPKTLALAAKHGIQCVVVPKPKRD